MELQVKKLGDLNKPIIEFANDVMIAEESLEKDDTPYNRRNYIRTVFAMIEGSIFLLKQATLSAAISGNKAVLSIADIAILSEKSFDISNKGEPHSQTKFFQIEVNFKYTIHIINKIFDCNIVLDTSSEEWNRFVRSVKIRNRITHPKSLKDFYVSKNEINMVCMFDSWFNEIIAQSVEGIYKRISRQERREKDVLHPPSVAPAEVADDIS